MTGYQRSTVVQFVTKLLELQDDVPEVVPQFLFYSLYSHVWPHVRAHPGVERMIHEFRELGSWEKGNIVNELRKHMDTCLQKECEKLWRKAREDDAL